jgi:hypothetical protein
MIDLKQSKEAAMKWILLTALLVSSALATVAQAQTSRKDKFLEKYRRTGKFENCIPLGGAIQGTKVLDASSLLFDMAGGDVYLNEIPLCPYLEPSYRSFTYDTSLSKLCNTDIITVIDPSSSVPTIGSCGLGRFELLKEKTPPTKAK